MPHPFQPDLLQWARRQHDLAREFCGSCRGYHATFSFRRLAGTIGGVEADAPALQPLLRSLLQGGSAQRVLVAGSADTGLTALLHDSAGAAAAAHHVLVVDRCETPLAASRAYGQQHGLAVQTLRCDLRELDLHAVADLIVGHSILSFMDAAGRADMLLRLARALAPGGQLLLSTRLAAAGQATMAESPAPAPTPGVASAPPAPAMPANRWASRFGHDVMAALAQADVAPPGGAAAFEQLLEQAATVEQHSSPYRQRDDLEAELAAAGFVVQQWLPGGRGLAFLDDGSVRPGARPTWIALAGIRRGP